MELVRDNCGVRQELAHGELVGPPKVAGDNLHARTPLRPHLGEKTLYVLAFSALDHVDDAFPVMIVEYRRIAATLFQCDLIHSKTATRGFLTLSIPLLKELLVDSMDGALVEAKTSCDGCDCCIFAPTGEL